MLTPSTIMAETDRLGSLLEILRNPDKYQKQIDELRQLSADTDEKSHKLVEETVEFQNLKNEVAELVLGHQHVVDGLKAVMDQATKTVDQAVNYREAINSETIEVVTEAKSLVRTILEASDRQKEATEQKVSEQEARIVELDKDIMAKETKLADIEARLAALRESMGA